MKPSVHNLVSSILFVPARKNKQVSIWVGLSADVMVIFTSCSNFMKIWDDRKFTCSGIIHTVYRFKLTRNKEPYIRNYLSDTLPAAVEQDTDFFMH